MNNDNLINKNNQLREKLNLENKRYYEDLLIYIRGKSTFNRENDVEQILLDMLHDLIDAQNNGQSAESYFGRDPQLLADEILKTLPKSFFETLKLACYIMFGYVLFFTIPNIVVPSTQLDLGNLIIFGTLGFIFSLGILWLTGQETYQTNKFKKYTSYAVGVVIFLSLIIGSVFLKTPLSFSLPGWWGIGTILILFFITTTIFIVERKRMPFLITIYVLIVLDTLLGIGSRIPSFAVLLTQPISKSTALWIILIVGPIVALVCGFGTYRYIMKNELN
ncbi:hypothetical protein GCM10025879_01800 [Leuconostoc litchii]|uniref:DUF1129 family protein n=1 Tax=Leuconostoc litchii TaxID=1981069 RepID=A0A6P2CMA1_9LACO|nr:hypothetical protein [Leuconostoc litchii]TYC47016.1 hypothetical protein ESZ47_02450 [Leuconostoc litchii]GMA68934.1 hypothetical protein GCM10025879_01800 [Leuconostoc litchii]